MTAVTECASEQEQCQGNARELKVVTNGLMGRFRQMMAGRDLRCAFIETRIWLLGPGLEHIAVRAHLKMLHKFGE